MEDVIKNLKFLDFCDQLHKIIGCEDKNCELRMQSKTIRTFLKNENKTDNEKKSFLVAYCKVPNRAFSRMFLKFLFVMTIFNVY